ncbi:DUF3489 domain-containing protein [Pseudomonas aeruginosa]|uniref:DUF3489 domain-containing protein n=1 Tax=Pseudomonas aeruginosa TaxID=287 RepID=UPI002044A330|nr:DUF3489 domain-containing protein [Pseudomonas aeruginosa]MCM3889430.1 DUF3489 domain-containing protein [Pseudomonas aeruginosa]MCM3940167.1 DUF3489 domain-containing protein [Pseudomonas aeruginosa]MCM3951043.1 DUF3489 domain-containing protein [Pseudomonas aeruginosa]MCM3958278.1 DUF3489 domain-containing protein [Pseudomonas aeruginosa]MCM3964396.1 DUF3489 domain-containing protein [Pseudomonas aeruginosa]
MTTTQLTPAQHAILAKAINTSEGKLDWFPDNIKGGARKKVLDGMFNRALITPDGDGWCVAAEGYDALGMKRPEITLPATEADAELEADVAAAEASWAKQTKPRSRENSKQAEVIRMLQRPEGATIGQICEATGWQAHTVRGTFAGAFKKKLGLTITSDKEQGGERVYRIA